MFAEDSLTLLYILLIFIPGALIYVLALRYRGKSYPDYPAYLMRPMPMIAVFSAAVVASIILNLLLNTLGMSDLLKTQIFGLSLFFLVYLFHKLLRWNKKKID